MGVAGLPNMPAGAQLRLVGGRGTLASKNPVMTVESYWPYSTTLFEPPVYAIHGTRLADCR
jgi:hypothetical protein